MLSSLKWQFTILVLVVVLVRGGTLLVLAPSLEADPDGYRWLAESLAVHGVFGAVDANGNEGATAFRPPAYPWLLSWCVRDGRLTPTAVAWVHGVLGIATSCLTFWLASRLFAPRQPADADGTRITAAQNTAGSADMRPLLAGLFVAVDPILLVQSAQVMTETLATFLAVLAWSVWLWLVSRTTMTAERGIAGIGLAGVLTVAFFSRPAFLIWAILLIVWLVGCSWRRRQRDFLVVAALVIAMLGGAIGWWTERNRRAIGHPVWATSHGGYTLLLGNNPLFYDYLRSGQWGQAWEAEPFHRAWSHRYQADPFAEGFWNRYGNQPAAAPGVDDELVDDRLAYDVAKATIRQQPMMFLWASLVRVGRLWSPVPHVTPQRSKWRVWGIGAFYLVTTVLVLAGVGSLRGHLLSSAWVPGLLLAIALTAVHAVYWSNLRMRAPAIPWLSLLAAAGVERLVRGRFAHRPQLIRGKTPRNSRVVRANELAEGEP